MRTWRQLKAFARVGVARSLRAAPGLEHARGPVGQPLAGGWGVLQRFWVLVVVALLAGLEGRFAAEMPRWREALVLLVLSAVLLGFGRGLGGSALPEPAATLPVLRTTRIGLFVGAPSVWGGGLVAASLLGATFFGGSFVMPGLLGFTIFGAGLAYGLLVAALLPRIPGATGLWATLSLLFSSFMALAACQIRLLALRAVPLGSRAWANRGPLRADELARLPGVELALAAILVVGSGLAVGTLAWLGGPPEAGAPGNPRARAFRGPLTFARLEWIRNGSLTFTLCLAGFAAVTSGAAAGWATPATLPGALDTLGFLFIGNPLRSALWKVGGDQLARPHLSALPIAPRQFLQAKTRALRRELIGWLPLLALIGALQHSWSGLAMCARLLVAALLLTSCAPALVLLSHRPAAVRSFARVLRSAGLEYWTLWLPASALGFARSPWQALSAVALLVLVSAVAKRAALLQLPALDEGSDELDGQSPAWRAVLIFAAFAAAQSFLGQVESELAPNWRLAGTHAFAATGLFLASVGRHPGLPTVRVVPARWGWGALGALLGLACGVGGLVWQALLERWPQIAAGRPPLAPGDSGYGFAIFTALALAPVAEETFFRGWLQPAVAAELGPARHRWAVPIVALGFCFVQPGVNFPASLALGLATGWLTWRSGALLPALLAHALRNALLIYFAGG